MVTEMTGIGVAGQLCGIPMWLSMVLADAALLATVLLNGYTLAERIAIGAGLFELFFFVLMIQVICSLPSRMALRLEYFVYSTSTDSCEFFSHFRA